MSKALWFIGGAASAIIGIMAYKRLKGDKAATGETTEEGKLLAVTPEDEMPKTEARWDLLQQYNRPTTNLTAY